MQDHLNIPCAEDAASNSRSQGDQKLCDMDDAGLLVVSCRRQQFKRDASLEGCVERARVMRRCHEQNAHSNVCMYGMVELMALFVSIKGFDAADYQYINKGGRYTGTCRPSKRGV
jgi:hypothetical protein